jgi:hypothetical protein
MTKTFLIAAVTAIGLSAVGITASYAEHGEGASTRENRSLAAIATQQTASNGPTFAKSLQGNQQAISGLLGAAVTSSQGIVLHAGGVNLGATAPSVCAPAAIGHSARLC